MARRRQLDDHPEDDLKRALDALDGLPPCLDAPTNPFAWISEESTERTWAAAQCRACPARDPCRHAGNFHDWGVWGGVDRSPRPGRPSKTDSTNRQETPA